MKTTRNLIARLLLFSLMIAVAMMKPLSDAQGWGPHGHELSGRAAAMKLPEQMPNFFRKAVAQLGYLNPEPDRWRDRAESDLDKALDSAYAPDHFLDLELVPPAAFDAVNRYEFTAELIKAGRKPTTTGFVPFRILELFQSLRIEFRLWRAERDSNKRKWIEQRIINDAGILGHYVSDAANPHHTTIHYNGWSGDNPKGYTVFTREHNQGIHYRFEELYVQTHIQLNDVAPLIGKERVIEKPREEIWNYLRSSNALVEQLYILDKQEKFDAETKSPEHKKFVSGRLAAGAQMLRDLWWTTWVTSAPPATPTP
ncbi:MAG TPA: nuclease [Blastocatellia bacterium]|nr:nuclease [Blastocatellia bacterium]